MIFEGLPNQRKPVILSRKDPEATRPQSICRRKVQPLWTLSQQPPRPIRGTFCVFCGLLPSPVLKAQGCGSILSLPYSLTSQPPRALAYSPSRCPQSIPSTAARAFSSGKTEKNCQAWVLEQVIVVIRREVKILREFDIRKINGFLYFCLP